MRDTIGIIVLFIMSAVFLSASVKLLLNKETTGFGFVFTAWLPIAAAIIKLSLVG